MPLFTHQFTPQQPYATPLSRGQVPAQEPGQKPVIYSIAGSDSSGGAGVEADLATFRALGVHGFSVITALTVQNSLAVDRVLPTPVEHVTATLQHLQEDRKPNAIKLGLMPNAEMLAMLADYLQQQTVPVICDPVIGASVGGQFSVHCLREGYKSLLKRVTLFTPNVPEAEYLLGRPIKNADDIRHAANTFLAWGAQSVLLKGGHGLTSPRGEEAAQRNTVCADYFVSHGQAFWLIGPRVNTPHHHGTGCTLASAIAASLALGYCMEDALVLAKMRVTQGLRDAKAVGRGAGPIAQGGWPVYVEDLPTISFALGMPTQLHHPGASFTPCNKTSLGLYPVVDHVSQLEPLMALGLRTLQLRVKSAGDISQQIQQAVALQQRYGCQLFINDHWQLAIEHGAFGVHLGQEDIHTADITAIAHAGLYLGLSNHSWFEMASSHYHRPSYMALGPVFATTTKAMPFAPLGIAQLHEWVQLLQSAYAVTAIGGINTNTLPAVAATGVHSAAVVRAVTQATDLQGAVKQLQRQLQAGTSPRLASCTA